MEKKYNKVSSQSPARVSPGRDFEEKNDQYISIQAGADSTMTTVERSELESPGHQRDALGGAAFFTDSSLVDDGRPVEVCMKKRLATRCGRVLSSRYQVILVGAGLAGIITAIILRHKLKNLSLKIFDKNSQVVSTCSEVNYNKKADAAHHGSSSGQQMR